MHSYIKPTFQLISSDWHWATLWTSRRCRPNNKLTFLLGCLLYALKSTNMINTWEGNRTHTYNVHQLTMTAEFSWLPCPESNFSENKVSQKKLLFRPRFRQLHFLFWKPATVNTISSSYYTQPKRWQCFVQIPDSSSFCHLTL